MSTNSASGGGAGPSRHEEPSEDDFLAELEAFVQGAAANPQPAGKQSRHECPPATSTTSDREIHRDSRLTSRTGQRPEVQRPIQPQAQGSVLAPVSLETRPKESRRLLEPGLAASASFGGFTGWQWLVVGLTSIILVSIRAGYFPFHPNTMVSSYNSTRLTFLLDNVPALHRLSTAEVDMKEAISAVQGLPQYRDGDLTEVHPMGSQIQNRTLGSLWNVSADLADGTTNIDRGLIQMLCCDLATAIKRTKSWVSCVSPLTDLKGPLDELRTTLPVALDQIRLSIDNINRCLATLKQIQERLQQKKQGSSSQLGYLILSGSFKGAISVDKWAARFTIVVNKMESIYKTLREIGKSYRDLSRDLDQVRDKVLKLRGPQGQWSMGVALRHCHYSFTDQIERELFHLIRVLIFDDQAYKAYQASYERLQIPWKIDAYLLWFSTFGFGSDFLSGNTSLNHNVPHSAFTLPSKSLSLIESSSSLGPSPTFASPATSIKVMPSGNVLLSDS